MNIKDTKKGIIMEIEKAEYSYWLNFSERFIQKAEQILEYGGLVELQQNNLKHFKQMLESIMFKVDVCNQDEKCEVEIFSSHLLSMQSVMSKWAVGLKAELKKKLELLSAATNGEDKRQLSDEVRYLTGLIGYNKIMFGKIVRYRQTQTSTAEQAAIANIE